MNIDTTAARSLLERIRDQLDRTERQLDALDDPGSLGEMVEAVVQLSMALDQAGENAVTMHRLVADQALAYVQERSGAENVDDLNSLDRRGWN